METEKGNLNISFQNVISFLFIKKCYQIQSLKQ